MGYLLGVFLSLCVYVLEKKRGQSIYTSNQEHMLVLKLKKNQS